MTASPSPCGTMRVAALSRRSSVVEIDEGRRDDMRAGELTPSLDLRRHVEAVAAELADGILAAG